MAAKEAKARIKINKLLEESGWRFFDDTKGKANIVLEPRVKLGPAKFDALGENFETSSSGFVDFLLLDEQGYPLVVLEAKAEDKFINWQGTGAQLCQIPELPLCDSYQRQSAYFRYQSG